jgi:phosphate butyryltransferase
MKLLSEIVTLAKKKGLCKIVVAAAEDKPVLLAIKKAYEEGIVIPVLIGDEKAIRKIAIEIGFDIQNIEIIDEINPGLSAKRAVACIKEGKASVLMKGLVATAPLLKAVLDKETGLRKSATLSHLALFESSFYHKVFAVTDAAMNINPGFEEKVHILTNAVDVFHRLGFKNPKVAVLTPVETVNEKIESTMHAAQLTMMNKRKQINGCIVDGPLALDNAISFEAAEHKGITSEVAGDADILMVSNLDSGNILYKSLIFLGGALSAAIITGASVPVVLTSRADSEHSKFISIALAAALE